MIVFGIIHFAAMVLDLLLIAYPPLLWGKNKPQTEQSKREERELMFYSTIPFFNLLILVLIVYTWISAKIGGDD